jgi:hypothetical protein
MVWEGSFPKLSEDSLMSVRIQLLLAFTILKPLVYLWPRGYLQILILMLCFWENQNFKIQLKFNNITDFPHFVLLLHWLTKLFLVFRTSPNLTQQSHLIS